MPCLSFAALRPGQRFRGPGRTLTETDHAMFSMLVADWHPIHADADYASRTPFGARLIHGSFGLALAMAGAANLLEFEEPVLAALGIETWRYLRPLLIGDTCHVEVEVIATRRTEGSGRLVVDRLIRLVNQRDEIVQEGRAAVMLSPPLPEAGVNAPEAGANSPEAGVNAPEAGVALPGTVTAEAQP